ncbi:MAG: DUF2283 domain-containing protein [Plectolyngbya sp. WJT66-NPBG17]|nr:DUF2283 domain-containing protein [Plectolyngbya sp. WJT66-NPBG17]
MLGECPRNRKAVKTIEESDEQQPGVMIDYDPEEDVIGVEILNASRKISRDNLLLPLNQVHQP